MKNGGKYKSGAFIILFSVYTVIDAVIDISMGNNTVYI